MSRTDLDRDSMWRPSDAERADSLLAELVAASEHTQNAYRIACERGDAELAASLKKHGWAVAALLAEAARGDLGRTA